MTMDRETVQQMLKGFGEEVNRGFKNLEATQKRELDKVVERIDQLEEQVYGVVAYLGVQAGKNDWQDITMGDEHTGAIIKRHVPKLNHRPASVFGTIGLAQWAGSTILAVQGIRREVQKLSQTKGEGEE